MMISDHARLVLAYFYQHPSQSFTIAEICQHLQLVNPNENFIEWHLNTNNLIYARIIIGQFTLRYSISDYGIYVYQQRFSQERQA